MTTRKWRAGSSRRGARRGPVAAALKLERAELVHDQQGRGIAGAQDAVRRGLAGRVHPERPDGVLAAGGLSLAEKGMPVQRGRIDEIVAGQLFLQEYALAEESRHGDAFGAQVGQQPPQEGGLAGADRPGQDHDHRHPAIESRNLARRHSNPPRGGKQSRLSGFSRLADRDPGVAGLELDGGAGRAHARDAGDADGGLAGRLGLEQQGGQRSAALGPLARLGAGEADGADAAGVDILEEGRSGAEPGGSSCPRPRP